MSDRPCLLLSACKTKDQQDLFWYYLSSCEAMGLHGMPMDPSIDGGTANYDPSERILHDAARCSHVRNALRSLLPEYRLVLEKCYTLPRVEQGELALWDVAAGYARFVQGELDNGHTPSWLVDELEGRASDTAWRRAWLKLKAKVKQPDVAKAVKRRVERAHGLYRLARAACATKAMEETRQARAAHQGRAERLYLETVATNLGRPVSSEAAHVAGVLRALGLAG